MEEEGGGAGGVRKRKWDGKVRGGGGGEEVGVGVDGDVDVDKEGEGEGEEEEEYEGIAEESVEEVMRWLEKEIAPAAAEGPPGFVTINGNEESCGPSFSAAASTVMASVDTRAAAPWPPPPVPWPCTRPWPPAAAAEPAGHPEYDAPALELELELLADGEWLAELLASAPPLEEQQQ